MGNTLSPTHSHHRSLDQERADNKIVLAQVSDFINISHSAALGIHSDLQIESDARIRALLASAISSLSKGLCSLLEGRRELMRQPKLGALRADIMSLSAARTKGFGIAFAAWDDPTIKSTDEKVARVKKSAIDLAAQELDQITGPDAVPEDENNERIAKERNQPDHDIPIDQPST